MADYSMEDEKWNGRKTTCVAWFEANPDLAVEDDREALAMGFFRVGDNHPENRTKYWSAISSLFAGLVNTPIGPGRSSNMSVGQKSQLDLYIEEYETSRVEAFNSDKHLMATAHEHGKSGGEFYRLKINGDVEYGVYAGKSMRSLLVKAFNAAYKNDVGAIYLWPTVTHEDGETQILDFTADNVPNITFRASEEEE